MSRKETATIAASKTPMPVWFVFREPAAFAFFPRRLNLSIWHTTTLHAPGMEKRERGRLKRCYCIHFGPHPPPVFRSGSLSPFRAPEPLPILNPTISSKKRVSNCNGLTLTTDCHPDSIYICMNARRLRRPKSSADLVSFFVFDFG